MNIALSPALRRFVDDQVKNGRYLDSGDVVREALRRMEAQTSTLGPNLGGLGDGEIAAMAFLVLIEAAKSAREDLKAIMEEVKAINAAKQRQRELLAQVQTDAAVNATKKVDEDELDFSKGLGSERAYHRVPLPHLDKTAPGGVRYVPTDLYPGKIKCAAQLNLIVDSLKNQLDSLSELGEQESLRLQLALDRYSKISAAVSNTLKKFGDTAELITQNLKVDPGYTTMDLAGR